MKESKYLTDFKPQEYAPFYDTEYKFGKLILRVNTAHPFYQKVWQPLGDLAKKTVQAGDAEGGEGAGEEVAETTRKALLGPAIVAAVAGPRQTQMLTGDATENRPAVPQPSEVVVRRARNADASRLNLRIRTSMSGLPNSNLTGRKNGRFFVTHCPHRPLQ